MPSMQSQQKKSGITIFIISLLAAFALALFYTYPQYKIRVQKKNSLAAASDITQKLNSDVQTASNSINLLNSNSDDIDLLNQALPDDGNLPDVYAYLEYLTKTSNLVLGSVQAVDESADSKSSAQSTLGVQGSGVSTVGVGSTPAGVSTPASASNASGSKGSGSLPASVGIIKITLDVSGSLNGVNSFLHNLEQSRRLIDVQSIEVSTNKKNNTTDFKLTLQTYYEKGNK